MKKLRRFPIDKIYKSDAESLKTAREFCKSVHSTGDIRTSGDELEIPFRNMLKQRLPSKYYVGHGHIVDKNLNVSPQFDVIIVDASSVNVLYNAANGTEYFPYESVYAIGEVKSTYYKDSEYIKKFIESIKNVKTNFTRENVGYDYISESIKLGKGFTVEGDRDIQNKLFTFMFFGSKNDINIDSIKDELNEEEEEYNPNIISSLDGLIITKAELDIIEDNGEYKASNTNLVLDVNKQKKKNLNLISMDINGENKSAQALSILILSIDMNLRKTRLKPPEFSSYIESIMESTKFNGSIIY